MSSELCENPTTPLHFSDSPTPARKAGVASRPRAGRFAVATLFFINGTLFATWVARIPALQAARGFSHAQLGLALLAMALGAMIAMPLAGRWSARHGSAGVCRVSALLYCVLLPVLAFAPGALPFVVVLFLFGAAHGSLDVAMNAHAVAVEERYARPIMSSFHALFSTGGLVGAAAGAALVAMGLTPLGHFSLIAILCGAAAIGVSSRLLNLGNENVRALPATARERRVDSCSPLREKRDNPALATAIVPALPGRATKTDRMASSAAKRTLRRTPALAALGIVALCIMMGEGAIADWSGVYLRTVRHASESGAAMGFAAFSIAMALGRFFGDGLTARLGAVRLVRMGGTTAAAGLLLALAAPGTLAVLVGLAGVGLGFSAIVPIVFSAAGRTPGIDSGMALAVVTTTGYLGFLIGPPLIGLVAERVGLPLALGIIVATSLLSVALAGAVAPRNPDSAIVRRPLRERRDEQLLTAPVIPALPSRATKTG